MAKNIQEPTSKLASAESLVLENKPETWGSDEHLAMLRYLVIACSEQAQCTPGTITGEDGKEKACVKDKDGKIYESVSVNLQTLKKEFSQSGKLAECSNFYKWLIAREEMEKPSDEKKTGYA